MKFGHLNESENHGGWVWETLGLICCIAWLPNTYYKICMNGQVKIVQWILNY